MYTFLIMYAQILATKLILYLWLVCWSNYGLLMSANMVGYVPTLKTLYRSCLKAVSNAYVPRTFGSIIWALELQTLLGTCQNTLLFYPTYISYEWKTGLRDHCVCSVCLFLTLESFNIYLVSSTTVRRTANIPWVKNVWSNFLYSFVRKVSLSDS